MQGEAEDFAGELAGDPEAFADDAVGADDLDELAGPPALPDQLAGPPALPDQPAGPPPLPEEPAEARPSTGEPRVDAALARLDELAGRPVTEHRAVFEDVHRRLRDVLGELDSGQPQPAGEAADAASRPGR
jgi:hypothetical protein